MRRHVRSPQLNRTPSVSELPAGPPLPDCAVEAPSDLNDYVECGHLTTLALEVARGVRRRPHVPDDHGDLRRKGEEHEAAYLAELRAKGRSRSETPVNQAAFSPLRAR